MTTARHPLPLPLWRRGKVRDVYEVADDQLLLVASDRISAFDVILDPPIPDKGRVLTQLAAFWFRNIGDSIAHHFISADIDEILLTVPALADHRGELNGRTMLVQRTAPVAFECVVRGYLAGSAWAEYRDRGTLAGERLPSGLVEASPLAPPLFSPATKAQTGHDENVTFATMRTALGGALADRLRDISLALFDRGSRHAAARGLILADTKFEFGLDRTGAPVLIDEVLTPDSSRFWPREHYAVGHAPPGIDKQPVRDWLAAERRAGRWNGEAPAPVLPSEVVSATTARYHEAYRRLCDQPLPEVL